MNPFPVGYQPSPERLARVRDFSSPSPQRTLIPQKQPTHGNFNPNVSYFAVKRQWSKERIVQKRRSKERIKNARTPCGALAFYFLMKWQNRFPHLYEVFLPPRSRLLPKEKSQ
ncbi:unnamed protein product, partial [Amoebophrya sp. A120]|eukprot:GSA120T00021732001.1